MAVQWKTGNKRGSHYFFAPEEIIIKPELNGREVLPDIEWIVQSYLKHGQIQDCEVRNEAGEPVLDMGFSRWRACIEFNKRELYKQKGQSGAPMTLRCVYFRGDEREGYLRNLAENRDRNETTPLDDAHACRRMEQWGMSVAEMATALRQSEGYVRNALKVVEGTVELKKAISEGRIKTVSAAAAIAKLSAEQQRKAVAGNGKVKAPPNGKPGMKDLRAYVVESYGNMELPKPVRTFCRGLIERHWPSELKAEQEAKASVDKMEAA